MLPLCCRLFNFAFVLHKGQCGYSFTSSSSSFVSAISKHNSILMYLVVRKTGWSSNFSFVPQLLGQVLNIITCFNWVFVASNKEFKSFVFTSIFATQDDALSRDGQSSKAMWFTVVIINIIGAIMSLSCSRLSHELVGQCDTMLILIIKQFEVSHLRSINTKMW